MPSGKLANQGSVCSGCARCCAPSPSTRGPTTCKRISKLVSSSSRRSCQVRGKGLRTAVRLANEAAGLDADAPALLVPYPEPRSLVDQVAEALQQRIASAAAPLRLEGLGEKLTALATVLPSGAPQLVPPLIVEIR